MVKLTEHEIQSKIFQWSRSNIEKHPEVKFLFAIPNGGKRNPVAGLRMKKEGLKKGVPDIFLPVARDGYFGLFVEVKTKTGRLSPDQKKWLTDLHKNGYRAVMCRGFEDTITEIEDYLEGDKT